MQLHALATERGALLRNLKGRQVRELIYREILEYHPHMLADWLAGGKQQPSFLYPSAVDNFKRQFAHLEAGGAPGRQPGAPNIHQASLSNEKELVRFVR